MTVLEPLLDDVAVRRQLEDSCQADRVTVIGVSGFGGAGKTTLCKQLEKDLPELVWHFSCDSFSRHSYEERINRIDSARKSGDRAALFCEENPQNWYDWNGIHAAIQALRLSRSVVWKRAWNKSNGQLDAVFELTLPAKGPAVVLCDCIYLLHDPVRQWFDWTMLVHADRSTIDERGRIRARSSAKAAELEKIRDRYEAPYFAQQDSKADYRFIPAPAQ